MTYSGRSNPRKKQRQKHESVKHAQNDDEQVHSKVVQLKNGGWRKRKDWDTNQFGGCDTCHYWTTHCIHCFHRAFTTGAILAHEIHCDVIAELDAEAKTSDQVNDEYGVHLYRVATQDNI